MSRYAAPDLSALGQPPALENIDIEAIIRRRLVMLKESAAEHGFVWNVGAMEADPLVVDQQTNAWFEAQVRARVNDGIKSVLLTSATDGQLDQIAATYYGISRLDGEKDQDFRVRIALAPESWSTAGPEGAYLFHGLEAEGDIRDAQPYSEEDGAVYADGRPVIAPEILSVVLAQSGDGTPSPESLEKVRTDLSKSEVRPLGDKVTVEPAIIHKYQIHGVLKIKHGVDPDLLKAAAQKRVLKYVNERRYIARVHQREGIAAAMMVSGAEELDLISPTQNIDPGSKGAGFCESINIETEIAAESWR